ncbi:uncharacterized protein LOC144660350 [Oculina patagonica]
MMASFKTLHKQTTFLFSLMQILSLITTVIPCSTVQTTDGGCCVFPFVYNSKPVNGCTTEDSPFNYWCAKTDNYDRDKDWGYCLMSCATVPTENGACCVFPFVYKGISYTNCTTHDSDRPWCAISSTFHWDNKYGYCIGFTTTAPPAPSTTGPTVASYYNVSQASCLPGWYYIDKLCFRLYPFLAIANDMSKGILNTARKKCLKAGADLAGPRDQSVLKRLWSVYQDHSWNTNEVYLRPLLLGAHDSLHLDWKWSDGSRVNSDVWGPGEPNTEFGKCGIMANLAKNLFTTAWCGWWLAATNCDWLRGFICESSPVNKTCKAGFVLIDGRCYKIYGQARLNWKEARLNCSNDQGDLAKVNTTAQREGLSALLETLNLNIARERLYVDLSIDLDSWTWMVGLQIDSSLWKSGYPKKENGKTCVVLDRHAPALKNIPCVRSGLTGFICQSQQVNAGFRASTTASSVAQPYDPSFAVDNNLSTCFFTKQELDPWIRVLLPRYLFISNVQLYGSRNTQLQVQVVPYNATDSVFKCNRNKKRTGLVFDCEPPVKSEIVQVNMEGNYTLVVCDVFISGIESESDAKGVLREVWNMYDSSVEDFEEIDDVIMDLWHVIKTLHAPVNFGNLYLQKLSGYFQVNRSGNHTFYMTCKQQCELWLKRINDLENIDSTKTKLIKLMEPTKDWNSRPKDQRSKALHLSKCYFYKLEAFMANEQAVDDHLSVGVRLPNRQIQKPMSGQHLYWMKPGKATLEISLHNSSENLATEVGSILTVTGSYRYCCHGMFCPDCDVSLSLLFLNKSSLLNHSLSMNCQEIAFQVDTEVDVHPGEYDVQAQYVLQEEDRHVTAMQRHLAKVFVKAAVLQNCFSSRNSLCNWETDRGKVNKWNGRALHFVGNKGEETVWFQSMLLPWKQAYSNLDTCLQFKYNTSSIKMSSFSLKVYLAQSEAEKLLIWSIHGYQENQSTLATVSWKSQHNTKVRFEGVAASEVVIYDVMIKTVTCNLQPAFAKPGYNCRWDEFQCQNARCMQYRNRCDGKQDCLDNSDEANCTCLRTQFKCPSGKCLTAGKLCDGDKDCPDGSDENKHCTLREKSNKFQCADGNFVGWSKTCKDSRVCQDDSHKPDFCESKQCPLNNLWCLSENLEQEFCDSSFKGLCNFEDGLCGMKHDLNCEFTWLLWKGRRTTVKHALNFDHTTLSDKGNYLFIDSLKKPPGSKARLLSGAWRPPSEPACLQFWYYKNGIDNGILNIYVITNTSYSLIWSQSKDIENRWIFVQIALHASIPFMFAIEGLAGNDSINIGLDDVTLSDGNCSQASKQENPGCNFEGTKCDWTGNEAWKLSYFSPTSFIRGKQTENHEHFLYLIENEESEATTRTISTRSVNVSDHWKCLRFWYYIRDKRKVLPGSNFLHKLEVFSVNLNDSRTRTLWYTPHTTDRWIYVQLSLILDKNNVTISFRGKVQSKGQTMVAIDDVSFSPEGCKEIPFTTNQKVSEKGEDLRYWKSTNGTASWKFLSFDEIKKFHKQVRQHEEHPGTQGNITDQRTINDVYELRFGNKVNKFTQYEWLQHDLMSATLCVWMRTKTPGLYLKYKQKMACDGRISIQVFLEDALLRTTLHGGEWSIPAFLVDDKWHHICVSWRSKVGHLRIYIDGKIKHDGFESSIFDLSMTGGGSLDLGFIKAHVANGIIGRISGLNVWDDMIEPNEIIRMSLGCANEAGNAESWARLISEAFVENDGILIREDSSCQDRQGGRLVLINASNQASPSLHKGIMSSWFNRSNAGHGKCVKFRFMFVGPGARSLHFAQKSFEDLMPTPIWAASKIGNVDNLWQYGQVSITGTKKHQLYFAGKLDTKHSYIAIGGLYLTPDYCEIQPLNANKGCNLVMKDEKSGSILSPQYPGYYTNNANCLWHLTVPEGHVIRLKFLFFDLEYHPQCSSDFVEVRDGLSKSSPLIGRFCSQTFPTAIESSGKGMLMSFKSNDRVIGGGFKARYHARQVQDDCRFQKGCPRGCMCFPTADKLLFGIESRDNHKLETVPKKIPPRTSIVLFSRNRISRLLYDDFQPLTLKESLQYIDLSHNLIFTIDRSVFQNMSSLKTLRLNGNFIQDIPSGTLAGLRVLHTLDLGDNLLSEVSDDAFEDLANLRILSLRSNVLTSIEKASFFKTSNLTHLYLQDNKISYIQDGLFQALRQLKVLYLKNNHLKTFTSLTFQGLHNLRIMHLQYNLLVESKISQGVFKDLTDLRELKIDKFILCCYAKKAIENLECESVDQNKFSSCEDMMKYPVIRACLWLLGILAFCGNLFVLIWRTVDRDDNRVQSIHLSNLAMADFLMGVYLLILAALDSMWKGEYFKHDVSWRNSFACQFVGAISMLSSEVSVAMLTITTADRLICVVFALRIERLTVKAAYKICLCVWVVGIVISILPIIGIDYFHDKSREIGFFSQSAVCLPLQLSSERSAGWEYAVAIFIALNFCSFVFILVAYIAIYWTMVKLVGPSVASHMQQESAKVHRLFVIVLTDFCCWMPVIIMSILSLTGNFDDLDGLVYVWVAVFVLPLNSSVNPILYTLATSRVKSKLRSIYSTFFIWRKSSKALK